VLLLERLVKFEILGQEFPFKTDAPEDEVQEILDLVKTQIEAHSQHATLLPAKLAILVSLNMAGKYVRLKRDCEKHELMIEEKISAISDRIEEKL